jgi:F-type H+-transporting ATPase subunit a
MDPKRSSRSFFKLLRNTILFTLLFVSPTFLFASDPEHPVAGEHATAEEHAEGHGEKKFNAGEMIIDHVSDSHEWHLWGEHTSIPLPIIIYSDRGLDMFMSSKFEHGHARVKGKYTYALHEDKVVAYDEALGDVDEEATAKLKDFSITKNVAAIIITMILMVWMFLSVARAYTRRPGQAPKGLQSFMEPLIIFIRDDVAKANIGEKKYKKFMPFLLTAFFFIWISNMMGLFPTFPGGGNVTGNIAVAMTLAAMTFLITLFRANGHYWHHIFAMPGVPAWVLIILTPIEILGVFLRPFVLMIRLFANIAAGHIIALAFFSLIFIFGTTFGVAAGYGGAVLAVIFTVFMMALELLVAFLQAYVFTLLSAVYFGAAVEEPHGNHDHHGSAEHHMDSVPASQEQQAII